MNTFTKAIRAVALTSTGLFLTFSLTQCNETNTAKETKTETMETQNTIFPKGNRGPAEWFTGTVWVQILVPDETVYTTSISSVTFEPNARSHWHRHPSGQILLVTAGNGLYQEKGKPVERLHKGDVMKCPHNIEHWHGASPESAMTHVAIVPNTGNGIVDWLQPVTDEEYNTPVDK